MKYIFSALTQKGEAKSINQDGFALMTDESQYGNVLFAVLCDGMGGLTEGEVASSYLVNKFSTWFDNNSESLMNYGIDSGELRLIWEKIIETANQELLEYGKERNIQLGTTIVALLLDGHKFYAIHVGDSRLYVISNSMLKQITEDHSLVQREVKLGHITKEEARYDPRRNVLLQGVGAIGRIMPNFYTGDINPNEVFIICSDGFYHEIAEDELVSILNPAYLKHRENLESELMGLIRTCKERGEKDDISVIAIKTD